MSDFDRFVEIWHPGDDPQLAWVLRGPAGAICFTHRITVEADRMYPSFSVHATNALDCNWPGQECTLLPGARCYGETFSYGDELIPALHEYHGEEKIWAALADWYEELIAVPTRKRAVGVASLEADFASMLGDAGE